MKLDLLHITSHSTEIFHGLRWGEIIACPECGSIHIYKPEAGQQHICADCDNRFSDTSGTIFHSTKLPLVKWLIAIYMFCSQSKGISSYNLARLISVSQPTVWRILTFTPNLYQTRLGPNFYRHHWWGVYWCGLEEEASQRQIQEGHSTEPCMELIRKGSTEVLQVWNDESGFTRQNPGGRNQRI